MIAIRAMLSMLLPWQIWMLLLVLRIDHRILLDARPLSTTRLQLSFAPSASCTLMRDRQVSLSDELIACPALTDQAYKSARKSSCSYVPMSRVRCSGL
ncbi:hypothetical protein F5Y01DRAFT_108617 [Xylaria sp. FL0043]|nr:hypothetical protein F5Y01DRAFT_108617 [Xylaria sp. FL0043]